MAWDMASLSGRGDRTWAAARVPAFTELAQHRPQFEANLNVLFQRGSALRQFLENYQRLLKPSPGIRKRRPCRCLPSGLAEVVHGLLFKFAAYRMIGEPLDLLSEPAGMYLFYCIHDARVDVAATFLEYAIVGDVVRQRMSEAVLQVREELRLIEKLSGLKFVEQTVEIVL